MFDSLTFSRHACERYCERVMLMRPPYGNVSRAMAEKQMRRKLATAKQCFEDINATNADVVVKAADDAWWAIVKGGVVTTVLGPKQIEATRFARERRGR